jgi:hypothetical protein
VPPVAPPGGVWVLVPVVPLTPVVAEVGPLGPLVPLVPVPSAEATVTQTATAARTDAATMRNCRPCVRKL